MFLNIAHRGDSTNAPENTLSAFESAIEAGASAVELDIRCTADGHVVVMHDRTVDRTTDGEGAVGRLSLEQVRPLLHARMITMVYDAVEAKRITQREANRMYASMGVAAKACKGGEHPRENPKSSGS